MGLNAPDVVRFEKVTKSYMDSRFRPVIAIQDISFSLGEGEFISLIGPSGCGKSTLLRLAAGLELATAGRVTYQGRNIAGPASNRGLVFQSYNAFPWLTVRQNVAFGLSGKNPAADSTGKVDDWLQFTGLYEFADFYPKALSGGMRQRLALARTMIVEPRVLLLDEPFGALDERTRENMQSMLLDVVSRLRCSVILVTHDIREAVLLSDRVVLLKAHPGSILGIFSSAFPKPRNRALMQTREFNAVYEEILTSFPSAGAPLTEAIRDTNVHAV